MFTLQLHVKTTEKCLLALKLTDVQLRLCLVLQVFGHRKYRINYIFDLMVLDEKSTSVSNFMAINSCWNVSLKQTNVNLMVALEKK